MWWEEPLRSETAAPRLDLMGAPPLPVWAIASLDGPARGMVVAWKDAGRRDLDSLLAGAARRAATAMAPSLPGTTWAVVPVPARRRSTARRGVDLPLVLANAAALGLADAGIQGVVVPALTPARAEQRGQGAAARFRQAAGIRAAGSHAAAWVGANANGAALPALLVDDVVTTGASMAAVARALEVTFLTACAGLALASAPGTGARPVRALR